MAKSKEASIRVDTLREQLKKVFLEQIPKIPEYIEAMPPEQKLAALTKMMPYIFPQVEKCFMREGEGSIGWGDFDD